MKVRGLTRDATVERDLTLERMKQQTRAFVRGLFGGQKQSDDEQGYDMFDDTEVGAEEDSIGYVRRRDEIRRKGLGKIVTVPSKKTYRPQNKKVRILPSMGTLPFGYRE